MGALHGCTAGGFEPAPKISITNFDGSPAISSGSLMVHDRPRASGRPASISPSSGRLASSPPTTSTAADHAGRVRRTIGEAKSANGSLRARWTASRALAVGGRAEASVRPASAGGPWVAPPMRGGFEPDRTRSIANFGAPDLLTSTPSTCSRMPL